MSLERLQDRGKLLASFDSFRREADASGLMEGMDTFGNQIVISQRMIIFNEIVIEHYLLFIMFMAKLNKEDDQHEDCLVGEHPPNGPSRQGECALLRVGERGVA